MKKAMQSVWIGNWSWFGGSWSGIKRKKMKKWQKKKELKNYVFPFRMNIQKIRTIVRNETERILATAQRGKVKTDFAWLCENFTRSCEMLQEGENGVDAFSTSHNCVKLLELVRNCIFSRFLGEEASEKPLRWCQVSTWPWPKIETWFTHFGDFYTFSNCRIFQISSLKNFLLSFIFSHFLTSQTCLVRPHLQAWVAKSHFSRRRKDLEARFMVN